MPIQNEDSIRSRYDRMLSRLHVPADAVKCHYCGESDEELREFHLGHACEFCATNCPMCGDWLGNEPETIVDGQRCHKVCAGDAITTEVDAIVSMLPSRKEVA